MRGHFAATILVMTGALALAANLGLIEINLVALLRDWWPVGLIVLGIALYFTPGDKPKV